MIAKISMKTELVRIGNSRGVRIPKTIIEQCGLGKTVELRVEDNRIVIAPERQPRQTWRDSFRLAGSSGHDELLLESAGPNAFDHEEWEW